MNNAKTTLVIQSFGRESEYKRALLTILSYYAHTRLSPAQSPVLLFTDCPDFFKPYVEGLPIEYVLLTSEKIVKMRGEINFLHRMKIALLEEAFQLTPGNLLYTDSDTFFTADPTSLVQSVKEEVSFMHLHEYPFEQLRNMELPAGKPFQAFLEIIGSKTFILADGSTLKVTPQHSSWNAGVMIFHQSHYKLIPDVFALTDQIYPDTQNHASEQYAFSIMLQNTTHLSPCDHVIHHYWYRIKKQIVDSFLSSRFSKQWAEQSLDHKIEQVREWTKLLPGFMDQHLLTLKDNSIQAFNENNYNSGLKWAWKALIKGGVKDIEFIKDVLYHTKRKLA